MKNIVNYPPSWCPDAVPSDRGWRHPKTGELLVSVKGGVYPIKKVDEEKEVLTEVLPTEVTLSETKEEVVIDETIQGEDVLVDEEPEEEEVISENQTTKKQKGRKKNVQ